MANITKFEDIEAWQKARLLTQALYRTTREGEFARDFALRDQIRRAGISAMSNIAEGFERGGNREFGHFLSIAKGSTGEVRSQLYVALDNGYLKQAEFDAIYELSQQTGNLLGGFMRYLQQSELRGPKFT